MKKIFLTILLYLTYSSINAQITTSINDVFLNSQTNVSNCNTLDFGTTQNNSLVFYFKLSRPSSLPSGTGTLRIMLKYDSTSNPQVINALNIQDSFWGGTIYESTIVGNITDSQVQVSGSRIYLEFETSSNLKTSSCYYPITKTQLPTFTLSPTTLSIVCGDTSVRNFTVTPANIPSGATVTYAWNYSGWSGSSTTNSINLTPFPGTTLPSNVSVTPFINGVAKSSINCTVSRASFNPISDISGNANLCPLSSSVYTLSNLGSNTVSWTSSNPAVASIASASGATVSVNGNLDGKAIITATILNACNQTATKTFSVNVGKAKISNYKILGGFDNVPQGFQSVLNVTPATSVTSYIWTVTPIGTINCSSSLPYLVSNGPPTSKIINWGNCVGSYRVRCIAVNSCGSEYYSDKIVRVFDAANNPCPPARMTLNTNPIKGDGDVVLNIIDFPNLPPCDGPELSRISSVSVYDLKNNELFTKKLNDEKEIQINNLNLKNGIYIVKLFFENGKSFTERLIVN